MQINDLKPKHTPKTTKRIGRGGKRGTYSGRGYKGQRSRAGAKIKPHLREIINKFPKRRGEGFKTIHQNIAVVNLGTLQKAFPEGGTITPALLIKKGLIEQKPHKKIQVKILAGGSFNAKFELKGFLVSKKAYDLIVKNGGTVTNNKEK